MKTYQKVFSEGENAGAGVYKKNICDSLIGFAVGAPLQCILSTYKLAQAVEANEVTKASEIIAIMYEEMGSREIPLYVEGWALWIGVTKTYIDSQIKTRDGM